MYNRASEASPTLTSTIEIEIPPCADIYIYICNRYNSIPRDFAEIWIPKTEGEAQNLWDL